MNHIVTALAAIAVFVGAAALADPPPTIGASEVMLTQLTVDGVDYPVCAQEDCSDQPGQVGLWLDTDTGNWWLSRGETSVLVIDDTVTEGN